MSGNMKLYVICFRSTDNNKIYLWFQEAFYVEYNEMERNFKKKIEVLKKIITTTSQPINATTLKNIHKNIIQMLNQRFR